MLTAYDTLLSHLRSRFSGDDHRPVLVEHLLVLALIAVLSIVVLDLLGDGLAAVDHLVSGPTSAP
jgi:Flp pilus assembly pilin Flp